MKNKPGTDEEFANVLAQIDKHLSSRYYEYSADVINENLPLYEGKQKAQLIFLRGIYYTMERDTLSAAIDFRDAYELDNAAKYMVFYIEALVKLEMQSTARPLAEQALKTANLHDSYRKMLEEVVNDNR